MGKAESAMSQWNNADLAIIDQQKQVLKMLVDRLKVEIQLKATEVIDWLLLSPGHQMSCINPGVQEKF